MALLHIPGVCGISKCLSLILGGLRRICIRLKERFKGLPAVGSAEENVPFPGATEIHLCPESGVFGSGMGFALYGARACWKGHLCF